MQVEAPPGEEMERELTAPKIIASLAFQGSLVVLGDEGMPFNPMGMMTCEKAMQKMFCLEKYMVICLSARISLSRNRVACMYSLWDFRSQDP